MGEETSQDLTINLEENVAEQEFEEVSTSSTTTTATTTRTTTTMTPTASIVEKVSEHLGEEAVLVVKSEGEKETIIAVPVQKIQQLIDALEVPRCSSFEELAALVFKSKESCHL